MTLRQISILVLAALILFFAGLAHQKGESALLERENLLSEASSLENEISRLAPSTSKRNEESAEKLRDLENEIREQEASLSQRASAEIEVREASASRPEESLSPQIRQIFQPLPAGSSPEQLKFWKLRKSLLQSTLDSGINDLEFLQVSPALEGNWHPIRIRYRATSHDTWKLLAEISKKEKSGPKIQIEKIRLRPAKGNFLTDLDLSAFLPTSSAR